MNSSSAIAFKSKLSSDSLFSESITHIEHVLAADGQYADFPENLNQHLLDFFQSSGITKLYSHQREVWDHIQANKNVVVVTPTASGKTLCYNLPVLQAILENPEARALYLFPTKALSRDQQFSLNEIVYEKKLNITTSVYDGDTPQSIRISARNTSQIIITNPDMLHSGILPNHAKWSRFFSNLQFIVLDEMHGYKGIFGSHVANVIRRIKRITSFYGARPKFILCSATIANPGDLARRLIDEDVMVVTKNGAPQAEKLFILLNPPLLDKSGNLRGSSSLHSQKVAIKLLREGIRTILFAKSRLRVEIIASYINKELKNPFNENNHIVVEPYRSGLLPSERRSVERGLREGTINGVVSTNALELGIDIGGLDAAVINGFPGSISSFWQQAGRAGRSSGLGMVFFVASQDPLDQFLITHPEYFFGKNSETARIDPENPYVYMDHAKCAAYELPFIDNENFGSDLETALAMLEEDGIVRKTEGRYFWSSGSYPGEKVSLRSATVDNVVIIDITSGKNVVIGEMDRPSAKELIFKNAVYIHRGQQFLVELLDIENRICNVREKELNYYTDSVSKIDLKLLSRDIEEKNENFGWVVGDVLVRIQVEKYKKIRFHTHENIGFGELNQSPEEMHTRAVIAYVLPDSPADILLKSYDKEFRDAVITASAKIVKSIAPVFLLCDPRDLGMLAHSKDENFNAGAMYFYDWYPGGTGLAENLSTRFHDVFKAAAETVAICRCTKGCPSCIGPDFSHEQSFLKGGMVKKSVLNLLDIFIGNLQ